LLRCEGDEWGDAWIDAWDESGGVASEEEEATVEWGGGMLRGSGAASKPEDANSAGSGCSGSVLLPRGGCRGAMQRACSVLLRGALLEAALLAH